MCCISDCHNLEWEALAPQLVGMMTLCCGCQDVFAALLPLYYASKLFGLAPYKYGKASVSETTLDVCGMAWAVFMCTLQLASLCALYDIQEVVSRKGNGDVRLLVLSCLSELLLHSIPLVAILSGILNRNKIIEILSKVKSIDQVLYPIYSIQVKMYKKTFINLLIALTVLMSYVLAVYVLAVLMTNMSYWLHIVYFKSDLTSILINVQFVSFVMLLKQRFQHVQKRLQNSVETWSGYIRFELSNCPERSTLKEMGAENGCKYLDVKPGALKHLSRRSHKINLRSRAECIRKLRIAYNDMHEVVETLNSVYGHLLLLDMTYNTIQMVFFLFETTEYMLHPSSHSNQDRMLALGDMFWSIVIALKIVSVCCVCESTHDAVRRLEAEIQKLLLGKSVEGDELHQLQMFASQLDHTKVVVSALGFYPVDMKLLYSVVGACTYYVAVLFGL